MSTGVDVLVVGGGPCGLAAALGAARRGRQVLLVEAAAELGGMAASFDVAGQRVDFGSHRLHPSAPPRVRALLDELLGDDLQTRQRDGRLHVMVPHSGERQARGRWVRFPLRAAELIRSVPPGAGLRLAGDMATSSRRHPADDSYAEYVRAGLGPTALAMFHGPMAAKLWGRDPGRLSAELARRRIAVNDGRHLVRRIARTSRASGRTFLYPRLGYGEIVDRLVDAAADAGVEMRANSSVRELIPGSPARVVLGDGTPVDAGQVLWTAPPGALARAAGAPDGTVQALTHRGVVLVYLALDGDRYSTVDAHYVPDPLVPFARLSEPKNYRDGPDPGGRTVLCAELPASVDDAIWNAGDADLAELVLGGMARVELRRPRVGEVAVRRLPRVYPVLDVHDDGRDTALAWADRLDGVAVLGRQGLHVADNLHHVLDMALAAVDCLDHGGWDASRWADERRRFDCFVVDD